jgi:hypothetical protein
MFEKHWRESSQTQFQGAPADREPMGMNGRPTAA